MTRFLPAVLVFIGMATLAHPSALAAQTPPGGPPQVAIHLVQAWVWPAWGDDATGAVGDDNQPYKSIQAAIDALSMHILAAGDPTLEGLVWCMPGVYGPTDSQTHGPSSSGDDFPIEMRHRVHVRGVSARRCIIRGVNSTDPSHGGEEQTVAYLGTTSNHCPPPSGSPVWDIVQVLVRFQESTRYSLVDDGDPNTPDDVLRWWAWAPEVAEILDGFTFQGGDVQVVVDSPAVGQTFPQSGRISNCIFDMRHMPFATPLKIEGPQVGLLLSSRFDAYGNICGYFDQKIHVANNTFVMAEYSGGVWTHEARIGAVGLIDVTATIANSGAPFDGNGAHRGIANPGIQNNLFRTRPAIPPSSPNTMAMIGIDASDCLVRDGDVGGAFVPTNAFAPTRVGTTSGPFRSTPANVVYVGDAIIASPPPVFLLEPMYYEYIENPTNLLDDYCSVGKFCSFSSQALPTPAVRIWDGSPTAVNERDPGFVGEFLTHQPGTPVLGDYADWRLLPGSPLIDQGRLWEINEFQNGTVLLDHPHELLSLSVWDGEGWGNVRVHGANADIGFDEVHLGIMAGSYANGSNSHNRTTHLNPSAAAAQSQRRILLPEFVLGLPVAGSTLRVKATERQAPLPIPPWSPAAWSRPPITLPTPLVDSQLPTGFQTAYINLTAEQWTVALTGLGQQAPPMIIPNSPFWTVIQVELPADDEGQNFTSHFNTQFVLDGSQFPAELRGNLQPEYR